MKQLWKKYSTLLFCMVISALYIAVVLKTTGIYYETNDDRCITEILSGVITLEPDGHAVYVNYLLALPLAGLYRIAPMMPWYGATLIFFHFIMYTVLGKQICDAGRNLLDKLVGLGTMYALIAAHFYMLGSIQYTSTAAMLAISGYVCLLIDTRKGKKVFWILELLGFLLRENAMLMIQPIGLGALGGWLLIQKAYPLKDKFKYLAQIGGTLCAIFLIGLAGTQLGYSSTEWKIYDRFNEAETDIFDFYSVSSYQDVKHILDKYQVSGIEYTAYLSYVILDGDITAECSEELADYVRSTQKKPALLQNLGMLFDKILHNYTSNDYLNVNRMTRVVWIIFGAWILFRKKWDLFLPAAGIAVGSFVIWGYLFLQGRLLWRVTMPLFLCETALLLALIMQDYKDCPRTIWLKAVLLGLCIGCCFVGGKVAKQQYKYVKEQNRNQKIYIQGMYEMQDYCRNHPENKYLIDAFALMYYRGSALDTELYRQRNSIVSGCWYSNSPSMKRKLSEYFEGASNNFRVIAYKDGKEADNITLRYFEERIGKRAVEEESFTASHGGIYGVFKFIEE